MRFEIKSKESISKNLKQLNCGIFFKFEKANDYNRQRPNDFIFLKVIDLNRIDSKLMHFLDLHDDCVYELDIDSDLRVIELEQINILEFKEK